MTTTTEYPAEKIMYYHDLNKLGFKEIPKEKMEAHGIYTTEHSRVWMFKNDTFQFIVTFWTKKNTWDLYAHLNSDPLEKYEYAMIAKSEGPNFREFFSDFINKCNESERL